MIMSKLSNLETHHIHHRISQNTIIVHAKETCITIYIQTSHQPEEYMYVGTETMAACAESQVWLGLGAMGGQEIFVQGVPGSILEELPFLQTVSISNEKQKSVKSK